jgi:esterase/lipase superfamily enzyme
MTMKSKIIVTLLISLPIFMALSGCSTPVKPAPEKKGFLNEFRADVSTHSSQLFKTPYSQSTSLEILYATNRDRKGAALGSGMTFGAATIHVPINHPIGGLDSSILNQVELPFAELSARAKIESDWGILVFVHGFNVDFEQALMRAAQIAFDLKFQGKVILLSWPAGSSGGFLEKNLINRTYEFNRRNAGNSIEPVAKFLESLSQLEIPIQLLVHSMGHQVVIPALEKISARLEHPFIQELILNAPDLDLPTFKRAVPDLKKLCSRITVYCSQNDHALLASAALNHEKRLGSCSLQEGADIVNVSEVTDSEIIGLGHGYYTSRAVLTDVSQVILGINASHRIFIKKATPEISENFILRK